VLLRVKNAKEKFQLFVIHIIQLAPLEPSGLDWNLAPLFVEELLWHKREKEFAARDFLNQLTTQLELEEVRPPKRLAFAIECYFHFRYPTHPFYCGRGMPGLLSSKKLKSGRLIF